MFPKEISSSDEKLKMFHLKAARRSDIISDAARSFTKRPISLTDYLTERATRFAPPRPRKRKR